MEGLKCLKVVGNSLMEEGEEGGQWQPIDIDAYT